MAGKQLYLFSREHEPKRRKIGENTLKTYTKDSLVAALIEIRNQGWIPSGRPGNDGGIGNTLEDLLGIEENNLPIPNAAEWELKCQKKNTTSLITLFHMEPSPTAYKFVPSILLPEYGWAHKQAGKKYSPDEKSFRQTINARSYSNRGFTVIVDRREEKVLIDFDPIKIDREAHAAWYDRVKDNILDPQPYWGFQDLFHKAGTKLHNSFFVRAVAKRIDDVTHFRYEDIFMLKGLDVNKLVSAIEEGNIYVDFDSRTGHNHGTKFRLRRDALVKLYSVVKEY